jgi:acyl-homoserine-lactone acylase
VLSNDVYVRAAQWYKEQPAAFKADLDAFAAGMNAYGKAHGDKLAPDVRQVLPITGVDVIAHSHRLMN